jgi:hypothetical protein
MFFFEIPTKNVLVDIRCYFLVSKRISISRPSDWSSKVKQLLDGNERIIAITIATKVNICIINAYLPTQRYQVFEMFFFEIPTKNVLVDIRCYFLVSKNVYTIC